MGLDVLCVRFQDKSDCKQMKKKIICHESVLNLLSAVVFSDQTISGLERKNVCSCSKSESETTLSHTH